ncbi:MAG: hypothetical protein ACFFFH_15050 [Candidatus Thorarchaeota archaeon]
MMLPTQILFLSFILIILVLLILLALDIDYLSHLYSEKASWTFTKTSSHKKDVEAINRQINLNLPSKSMLEKLIQICPVNAINESSEFKESIIIVKSKCLGKICLECLRLVLSEQQRNK